MRFFKTVLVLGGLGFILAGLSSCGSGEGDFDPLAVVPKDSDLVMTFDYTDKGQRKIFQQLKTRFPETGLWQDFVEEYNKEMEKEFAYESFLKPIIEGNWKISMAISMWGDEVEPLYDLEKLEDGGVEVMIAGYFAEADKVEKLIEELAEKENYDLDHEKKSDADFWTNLEDDFFLMRKGDLFVLTNTEDLREQALKKTERPSDFDYSGFDEGVMHMYVSGDLMQAVYKNFEKEGIKSDYFDLFGDVYMKGILEEDGVRMYSEAVLIGDEEKIADLLGTDYAIEMVDKVPGKGVAFYMEMPGLINMFQAIFANPQVFSYKSLMRNLEEIIGLSEAEFFEFLDSPYALSVADVGQLYPTFSLYVVLDKENLHLAKKLTSSLDDYVDEVIVEFDKQVSDYGFEGALKKNMEELDGSMIHKLYVDWDAVDSVYLKQFVAMTGIDVEEIDVEIYYGVISEDVFVFALYPDFVEDYDLYALADNGVYKEAVEQIENDEFMIQFFDIDPLMNIVDRYMEIARQSGQIDEKTEQSYAKVRDFISVIKYMVAGGELRENVLESETFVKIGEM